MMEAIILATANRYASDATAVQNAWPHTKNRAEYKTLASSGAGGCLFSVPSIHCGLCCKKCSSAFFLSINYGHHTI